MSAGSDIVLVLCECPPPILLKDACSVSRACSCPIESGRTAGKGISGVGHSTGTMQLLTCEAKATDAELSELREGLDDEVDLCGWELVVADIELGEGFELGHGPRQGCRNA